MSRWPFRRPAALLLCLLAVAGCSSSGDDARSTLKSVLLQLSDFPPTWRGFPVADNAGDVLGELAACTGVKPFDRVATVQSLEFRHLQQRITSTGVALKHREDLSKLQEALGSPKANKCAAQATRQRVLAVVPGATIKSSVFSVRQGGVQVEINYAGDVTGVVTVDVGGQTAKVYVNTVFLLGVTYYSDITFVGAGQPISESIRHVLTDRVALREQRD
jgi:hypothetical protein